MQNIRTLAARRIGFTLVELLVVIAIIGVLVALLLPAVQAAREAARRIQCKNNLKNLALAVLIHENQQGDLPAATEAHNWLEREITSVVDVYTGNQLSWIVRILPYLEQQSLYDQFDFDVNVFEQDVDLRPEENQPGILLCPSDGAEGRFYESDRFSEGRRLAKGNYAAYVSPEHGGCMKVFRGSLIHEPQALRKLTDGMSNTVMLSEVRTRDVLVDQRGTWSQAWFGATMLALDVHSRALGGSPCRISTPIGTFYSPDPISLMLASSPNLPAGQFNADDMRECTEKANADALGMPCQRDSWFTVSPRSSHPGGVNAANVDGSVRWIPDEIDVLLLARLVSIDDGEIVGEYD
jgi:prepilin-type N-terminal cleavage/methylation domain-containing protein